MNTSVRSSKDIRQLKTIDLFAGVGGVRLGFEKAGFETLFANDYEPKCKETYDLNFKNTVLTIKDIREISVNKLPSFDFLLAGFPCQAFSIAGYREGFNDKKGRGNLFFNILEILKVKRPKGFLLENVKNLQGHDKGRTFETILNQLDKIGYSVKWKVMNTMEYGNIPQNRERIYIIGFRKELKLIDDFKFPRKTKLRKGIIDILEENVDEKFYYNGKPLFQKLLKEKLEFGTVYQWRRVYLRENKSGVCPTLTANMGTGGHNVPIIKDRKGIRKLTPRECARLQGFPESYKLPKKMASSHLYKQFGNSVSVPVIYKIAKEVKRVLTS